METDPRPLSDGGDGFLAVVRRYDPGVLEARALVPGPTGEPVEAAWGWDPDAGRAFVESAAAIGLARVPEPDRDPLALDTAGLGRLLAIAAGLGVEEVVVGLGGSATVDGGLGMARALGWRFEDAAGRPVEAPGALAGLARIVPPPAHPLGDARVVALADVPAPLLGPDGAAAVFGPQKSADAAAVERLAAGLQRMAERWRADLGAAADLAGRPGAGAAGGLGAALVAFLGARLESGAAWCAARAGLTEALAKADALVTGEGAFDAQSAGAKATGHALAAAREAGVPAAVVCGRAVGAPEGALVLDAAALGRGGALDRGDLAALARRAVAALRALRPEGGGG